MAQIRLVREIEMRQCLFALCCLLPYAWETARAAEDEEISRSALLPQDRTEQGSQWMHTAEPRWGLRKGLRIALHPAGFGKGTGGSCRAPMCSLICVPPLTPASPS